VRKENWIELDVKHKQSLATQRSSQPQICLHSLNGRTYRYGRYGRGSSPLGDTKIDFVTQRLEYHTFNMGVDGSNPSGVTKNASIA
jgi:hypothetical protein